MPINTKSLIAFDWTIDEKFSIKTLNVKLQWTYRFIKRYRLSLRRISHKGQTIPETKEIIKKKFIDDIISKRKELAILEDEDYRVINMDETPCYLEMWFKTTIDFKGKKDIEIATSGRDHHRITVILTVVADDVKSLPIVIVKGEEGKIIENQLRKLKFVKNNQLLVYCQR